jgi:hypothetical protein
MDYPAGFPKHLQPPVDAAIHDAELDRLKLRTKPELWQGVVYLWVKKIFFAFAEQVCQAGMEDIWTGEQMRKELDEYLPKLALRAYYENSPPHTGDFPYMKAGSREIVNKIKTSSEWESLQRNLKQVAESRSASPASRDTDDRTPPEKKTRRYLEPKPELLKDLEATLSRLRAAEALGIDVRTLDRWVVDKKLTPSGIGARKRFKVKDLKKLFEQRNLDKRDIK